MNHGRWFLLAWLPGLFFGACGGKEFGDNAGGSGGAAAGNSAQAGGIDSAGSGRAGTAGSSGQAQGGSSPQGEAGDANDSSAGAAGAAAAAGAAGGPNVDTDCDPTAPFGDPELLPGDVNSDVDDMSPRLSKDELTIYFVRRPVPVNDVIAPTNLYAATRSDLAAPFKDPAPLAINTDQNDGDPMLTRDDGTLFFSSDRPNGFGELDLYQSSHAAPGLPFVTASAVPDVNSPGSEVQPFASADGELWFAYRKAGPGYALHLRRAPRIGVGYGVPVAVKELDSTAEDSWPLLSLDKRTIYYSSTRTDGGAQGKADIWRAQRDDPAAVFDPPTNVNELNSAGTDYVGWLSEDNCRLYLSSNRTSSAGSYAIYVAKR
jgi:hypothetical protein